MASAAALLPRLSPPDRLSAVSLTLTPGHDISPTDLGDLLSMPATRVRIRWTSTASSAFAAASSTSFPPAPASRCASSSSATRSNRSAATTRRRSDPPAALDQAAIAPLQELLGDRDTPDRSATVFDYLWADGRPAVIVSEPDDVRGARGRS